MSEVRQVIAIIKRELRAWFDHPTGYLLVMAALACNAFFFFRSLAVNPVASLRASFHLLPWLLMFLVPAVTMRLVAEDRKSGVLETTLARPVSPWTYLAGKLMAGWKFFGIFLVRTLPIPLTLAQYGDFDWGIVAAEYIGALLLALNFLLFIIGYEVVTVSLPAGARFVAENLSLAGHFQNVTRGVLDLRDALYFLTLTGAAVTVAAWLLVRTQWSVRGARYRRMSVGVALVAILAVGVNLAGARLRGRIDFTGANAYTLSPAAKTLLGSVPDVVTIKLYATQELPPQVALLKRDAEDLLADIRAAGKGQVTATSVLLEEGQPEMEEARSSGVQSVQFNVLKEDSFQAQNGMFGLVVSYAGGNEVIGYLDRTDDLEYRIVRLVKKLTVKEKPAVAMLTGFGDQSYEMGNFRSALGEFYTVTNTDISTGTPVIAESAKAAVLAGPAEDLSDAAKKAMTDFIDRGGS